MEYRWKKKMCKKRILRLRELKSGMADSNRRPLRPERSALPAALIPEKEKSPLYKRAQSGAKGLEPSISGVTGQRDNQLRYAPS